jgi:carbon starvation protein
VGLTILKTFIMTTLDSATRISRYIGEELFGESMGVRILHNRFVATAIIIGLAFILATGSWQTVWPVFGSANQLIAALALLVLTVVLWRRGKQTAHTLIPLAFMLATALGALGYQGWSFFAGGKFLLGGISIALVALAVVMVVDSLQAVRRGRRAVPSYAEPRYQATASRSPSSTDTSGS